ncbi:MAG: hypothetical protein M1820_003122 [Bogoriella megaspora]|nr:MAG: hypothetical protein M1820_003122 [Bogoriella megaspora]
MAHRKKKARQNAPSKPGASAEASKPGSRIPKSMVVRIGAGEVGPSISQLVKDVREMVEPHTASRLKERKRNKLRDYTTMCGPLGVSHLLLFSRSETGNTNLRLAITPRGPTLHFRVDKYSLAKDVTKSQKRPRRGGQLHLNPPLLVLNNFLSQSNDTNTNNTPNAVPKHLEQLTTTVFQSLFPPISPQSTPLNSIRRVLLVDREVEQPQTSSDEPAENSGAYRLTLRHYAITTRSTSVPKPLRRLENALKTGSSGKGRGLPHLGKLDDVADYLLDPDVANYTSGSDSEVETDAEVEVLQEGVRKVIGRRKPPNPAAGGNDTIPGGADGSEANRKGHGVRTTQGRSRVEKRAVKLVELGPRLSLRLMKVEEGLCGGKVMWHESVQKSKDEQDALDRVWDERRKEKEKRKAEQKANVERKRKERAENGGGEEGKDGEVEDEEAMADWDMDDDEWDDEGMEMEED